MVESSIGGGVEWRRLQKRPMLRCGICGERYSDPRLLPCLHTFCCSCLRDYIPAHSLSVNCPTCRQQSILPANGISALQTNSFVVHLMTVLDGSTARCALCRKVYAPSRCTICDKSMCAVCEANHRQDPATAGHEVTDALGKEGRSTDGGGGEAFVCCHHDGQALDVYCVECDTSVCVRCTEGEHRDHQTLPLTDAVKGQRAAVTGHLNDARDQVPSMEDALMAVEDVSDSLRRNHRTSKTRIREAFESLGRTLSQRRDTLIAELDKAFDSKLKTLEEQSGHLEELIVAISGCCDFTFDRLNHSGEGALIPLLARKELSEKLNQLHADFSLQKFPEENDLLVFDSAELSTTKKCLKNFGLIRTNSAVAQETSVSGEAVRHCWVNRQAAITITTKDRLSELVRVGNSSFAAKMISECGESFAPDITDNHNGTYELTYLVRDPGTYVLEISLYGRPIKGSPFRIKAERESDSLERRRNVTAAGRSQGGSSSAAAAVKQKSNSRPNSSRSQGSNNRRSGANTVDDDLIMSVGFKGRGKGEFLNPQGVATRGDSIVVADSNNQCVQIFSSSGGECRLRFGTRGRLPGQLQRPTGVSVSAFGNYLVADYDNKWVSVFDLDGKYLSKIGVGKLLGPKGVCVDREGHVIIVDNKASCVLVFQSNGKLLHKFGSRGSDDRHLAGPHFCAVNSVNDILVTDFHNHRVRVFDSEGTHRFSFGSSGEGNGQFNAPTGIAVDKHDNILVADWGNSRIQVYRILLSYIISLSGSFFIHFPVFR